MASHGEAIQINLARNLQVVLLMFLGVKGLKINKRDNYQNTKFRDKLL